MSTICMPGKYGKNPHFNPYGNKGLSDDAYMSERQISGTLDNSIYFGLTKSIVLQTLYDIIEECSVDNWDGYGAKAIDMASFNEARRFLCFLPESLPTPEIAVEPDGEIAFEWFHSKRRVFSVSIGGTGELAYAGLFGINKMHGTEFFGEKFPKIILNNIHRVLNDD